MHGNCIATLGTIVTHRPEAILEGIFMNYVNVILANLLSTILINRSSQWKETENMKEIPC